MKGKAVTPPAGPNHDARVRFGDDVSPRKKEILEAAARLFARKGYKGASIRDIGVETGVLGGSLYHHIKSKDALFVELHNAALDSAARRIETAISNIADAWTKLEVACTTLLAIQVDADSLTFPLMNDFREVPEDVRHQLITRRDAFEGLFRTLVETLPLPQDIDRSIYRNLLLSQINTAAHWYRPGRLTVEQLARQILRIYRHPDS